MEMTICNPQKGRLETIKVSINETNTTWFDDCLTPDDIYMITGTDNGLLIRENNYNYPVLVYDVTRSAASPTALSLAGPEKVVIFREGSAF